MTRFCFVFLLIPVQLFLGGCKRDEASNPIPVDPSLIGLNSDWQIGYSAGNMLTPGQFRPNTFVDQSDVIIMCHPSSEPSGYYPYIGRNMDVTTQTDVTASWAAKSSQFVMEGSNSGQFSMLRFKVPVAGKYKIKAVFEGIHFGLSSTDVHILHNSLSLFDEFIEGYGGDAQYHSITGSNPSASYEDTLQLNKYDTIIFAVGYGKNKTHYNDTTGLIVSIEPV